MEPTLLELYRHTPGPKWFKNYTSSKLAGMLEEMDIDALVSAGVGCEFWSQLSKRSPMEMVERRPDYLWKPLTLLGRADLTPEAYRRLNVTVDFASTYINLEFPLRMPELEWRIPYIGRRVSQVTLSLMERYLDTPELKKFVPLLVNAYSDKHTDPVTNILQAGAHYRLLASFNMRKKHMDLAFQQLDAIVREAPEVFLSQKGKLTKHMIHRDPEVVLRHPELGWAPIYIDDLPREVLEKFLDIVTDVDPYTSGRVGVAQSVSLEYIVSHPDIKWYWKAVCLRADLHLSLVRDHPELPWKYHVIASSHAVKARGV